MNPSARNPWKQLGACPYCGHVPPDAHVITSQTRYMLDVECPRCGGAWRADRASGKLIARLTIVPPSTAIPVDDQELADEGFSS